MAITVGNSSVFPTRNALNPPSPCFFRQGTQSPMAPSGRGTRPERTSARVALTLAGQQTTEVTLAKESWISGGFLGLISWKILRKWMRTGGTQMI